MVLGASFLSHHTLQGGFAEQTKMASLISIYCNNLVAIHLYHNVYCYGNVCVLVSYCRSIPRLEHIGSHNLETSRLCPKRGA